MGGRIYCRSTAGCGVRRGWQQYTAAIRRDTVADAFAYTYANADADAFGLLAA